MVASDTAPYCTGMDCHGAMSAGQQWGGREQKGESRVQE